MAQKRMLHKRLLESEKIQALRGNDRARFIYTALLPFTDKLGRLNVNPMGLKGTILEPFEYTAAQIEQTLADLSAVGLIVLYRTGKHALLAEYTRFTEFNTPHPNEAESDLPGPDDPTSTVITPEPSGNLPEDFPNAGTDDETPDAKPSLTHAALPEAFPETARKMVIAGSSPTPTPTNTPTQDLQEEDAARFENSPEARFARLTETGSSEHGEVARTRAVIRRLAGPKFAQQNEASMTSWSRHSTARLIELWAASDPSHWPKEPGKRRPWFFTDLLNEERYPPGEHQHTERVYDDIDGGDLLGIASPNGDWGPS